MSVELVTGYKGEPHISSADVSNLLQGIIGENIVVLNVGNKMVANPISANEIDIEDGGAVFQGKHFVIPAGDIEPCIIQNGSQGTYRRDLIVAHYVKSLETSVESVEIKVLKGTEAQTKNAATAPTYITGNIWEGATVVEAPLYEVLLNGINIESITPKYDVMKSAEETKADIAQINADLSDISNTLGTTAIPFYTTTDVNGNIRVAGVPEIKNIPRRRFASFTCISANAITIIPYIDQNLNELFLHPKSIFGWNDLPNTNIYIECIVSNA